MNEVGRSRMDNPRRLILAPRLSCTSQRGIRAHVRRVSVTGQSEGGGGLLETCSARQYHALVHCYTPHANLQPRCCGTPTSHSHSHGNPTFEVPIGMQIDCVSGRQTTVGAKHWRHECAARTHDVHEPRKTRRSGGFRWWMGPPELRNHSFLPFFFRVLIRV
jgi:hypothetical protein